MFPAWSQVAPPQTLRRLPLFEQEVIPLSYYGTAYGAFTPQAREPAHYESVSNGIEEATRAEIKAVEECEKAREEYEEAKKKLEECEVKVKEAQTRLQWAKYRGGLYG
jgi:hypothetical protein